MKFSGEDITNQKFGKLLVIEPVKIDIIKNGNKQKETRWKCNCDCGGVNHVTRAKLKSGHTSSCGCMINAGKHHLTGSRTYVSWDAMKRRCNNPQNPAYKHYGGRGIKVCDRWMDKQHGFENFYEDMGERPKNKSIDRYPDRNGNYEPDNCRWATRKQQMHNLSISQFITYNNETKSCPDWEDELGYYRGAIRDRIENGWTEKECIENKRENYIPPNSKFITFNNEHLSLSQWSKKLGIKSGTISSRLKRGWTIEKALTTGKQKGGRPKK